MPELTIFDACNDAAAAISDRRTRALNLAKEGTVPNNVPTPDTEETKVEGMKIDNELIMAVLRNLITPLKYKGLRKNSILT